MARGLVVMDDEYDTEVFIAVGMVTIAAGQMEYALKVAHKRAKGEGWEAVMDAADEVGFEKRCELLRRDFNRRVRDPIQQERLAKALLSAKEAWSERHKIVHGVFAETVEDRELIRFYRAKPEGSKTFRYPVNVQELHELARKLRDVRDELHTLTASSGLSSPEGQPQS